MKTYNSESIKQSLREYYNIGTVEDEMWYDNARNTLYSIATEYDVFTSDVANLCAILSPRNAWENNVSDVCTVLAGVEKKIHPDYIRVHTFNTNKYKAIQYVENCMNTATHNKPDYVKGQKVTAFARALKGDYTSVVVDNWMVVAANLNPKTEQLHRNGLYGIIENCVLQLSDELNVEPARIQARIWCAVRRHYGYPDTY